MEILISFILETVSPDSYIKLKLKKKKKMPKRRKNKWKMMRMKKEIKGLRKTKN